MKELTTEQALTYLEATLKHPTRDIEGKVTPDFAWSLQLIALIVARSTVDLLKLMDQQTSSAELQAHKVHAMCEALQGLAGKSAPVDLHTQVANAMEPTVSKLGEIESRLEDIAALLAPHGPVQVKP